MLSKKDKEWITQAVKDAVIEALTVELEWVKKKDEETGIPLAAPEYKVEKTFLPFYWIQHLKFHEGAYRGMQETVDKASAMNERALEKLQALGEFLIGLEPIMRNLLESHSQRGHDSQAVDQVGSGDRSDT